MLDRTSMRIEYEEDGDEDFDFTEGVETHLNTMRSP